MIHIPIRKVIVFPADNFLAATEEVIAHSDSVGNNTYIDATSDRNHNKWLGQELQNTLVFFDDNTKMNALLAIMSCVRGGHTLYLSYPPNQLGYFKRYVLLPHLQVVSDTSLAVFKKTEKYVGERLKDISFSLLNEVLTALTTSSVVHCIGLRGTGKSTLLGLVANELSGTNHSRIALVSQYKTSSHKTLSTLNNVSRETVSFFSPSEFRQHIDNYSLILVDETASLPKEFIRMIVEHAQDNHCHVVLATTIEGYEGTGQSYKINYVHKESAPIVYFTETLRFPSDDPLHCLCQKICQPTISLHNYDDGIYVFTTEQLRTAKMTESCFTLLQKAHYKTTPNDLERFYNDDAVFAVAIEKNAIISIAYALPEQLSNDVLDDTMLNDIFYGVRRVKNAMTQQSLINAYGVNTNIAASKILRVSRIVTQYDYQRMSYASRLIRHLQEYALSHNYHLMSTSFTLTPSTYAFWSSTGFIPARIGIHKNKSHDKFSILMLLSMSVDNHLHHQVNVYHQLCTRHIMYYSQIYSDGSDVDYASICHESPLCENVSDYELREHILSVIRGHRDIHWVLPILRTYYDNDACYPENLQKFLHGNSLNKNDQTTLKKVLTGIL